MIFVPTWGLLRNCWWSGFLQCLRLHCFSQASPPLYYAEEAASIDPYWWHRRGRKKSIKMGAKSPVWSTLAESIFDQADRSFQVLELISRKFDSAAGCSRTLIHLENIHHMTKTYQNLHHMTRSHIHTLIHIPHPTAKWGWLLCNLTLNAIVHKFLFLWNI